MENLSVSYSRSNSETREYTILLAWRIQWLISILRIKFTTIGYYHIQWINIHHK
jgi:hypothetical protein